MTTLARLMLVRGVLTIVPVHRPGTAGPVGGPGSDMTANTPPPRSRWPAVLIVAAVVLAVAITLTLTIVGSDPGGATSAANSGSTAVSNSQKPPAPVPGTPAEVRPWTSAAGAISGKWVRYRTTDPDGRPLMVTAVVFVPTGHPPAGGWPVVALGHGSVGINAECAPSLTGNLSGMSSTVRRYLHRGIAVTLADYPGLGATPSSPHPYLDSYAAARSMIDSVRALRRAYPNVSTTWITYGISQGGGASWAAAEIAADYAPDLHLLGAVAQVPSTDKSGLIDRAANGTLSVEQEGILQWLLESFARQNPALNLDDLRSPELRAVWSQLSGCGGDPARDQALRSVSADDFTPRSTDTTQYVRTLLEPMSPPHQRTAAPLLVVYGGDDRFVDAAHTEESIVQACEMGSAITIDYQPWAGHLTVDTSTIWPYLHQRLGGATAPNDCPR